MRTAVVLPAPFGPSTPRIAPAGTSRSSPSSATVVAESLGQALRLDHRAVVHGSFLTGRQASHVPDPRSLPSRSSSKIRACVSELSRCPRNAVSRPAGAASTAPARLDPRAHPRHRARAVQRAGLRQDVAARDRRAARRHQGGALLPLRAQGGHPAGAAPAPARARPRHARPARRARGDRDAARPGRSCWTSSSISVWPTASCSSSTSATRAPSRARAQRAPPGRATRISSSGCAGFLANPAIPLAQRVRMACSFGAVSAR